MITRRASSAYDRAMATPDVSSSPAICTIPVALISRSALNVEQRATQVCLVQPAPGLRGLFRTILFFVAPWSDGNSLALLTDGGGRRRRTCNPSLAAKDRALRCGVVREELNAAVGKNPKGAPWRETSSCSTSSEPTWLCSLVDSMVGQSSRPADRCLLQRLAANGVAHLF